ncbi:UNVERIFIED_ORG: DinB family protein [Bacillus sp. AZ43]
MPDARTDVPRAGGERELLRAYLDFHRQTLAMKCAGLSDGDLRRRAAPPSTLSLLGLVRHMAEVERAWFRRVIDGQDVPWLWSREGDHAAAFDVEGAAPADAFAAWEAEIAHARRIEAAAPSLDVVGVDRRSGDEYSLRRVMVHVVQEYARHNGHADLLRERIDGATGV